MLISYQSRSIHGAALAVLLGAGPLWGAGFALYETSARSVALGGATVGAPRAAATGHRVSAQVHTLLHANDGNGNGHREYAGVAMAPERVIPLDDDELKDF